MSRRIVHGLGLAILLALWPALGQEKDDGPAGEAGRLSDGELEQLVAPIALYPDDLLSQVLMASTYPLEVVQAQRWAKGTKLEGDALAKALDDKPWDPSVKSLVNFPDVLEMLDGKLDWTQRLGNAFLAQQEDVMNAIQRLRKKAQDAGNLKDSKEQKVETDGDTIVIVPADPEVIYVPVYNTTVVYGTWLYPAYPPYFWYPPRYPRPTLYGFGAGLTLGFAWGYAWGRCSWHQSNVNIDINRNVNINRNINRDRYRKDYQTRTGGALDGKGAWKHDPSHRRGVAYGDKATAQRFNRGPSPDARSRDAFRGRTTPTPRPSATQRPTPTRQPTQRPSATPQRRTPARSSAFSGYDSRQSVQRASSRGHASRQHAGAHRAGGTRGGGRR